MTTIHPPRLRAGSAVRLRTRLVAVFLALHGLTHFAGTSVSLKLIDQGKAADYLGGFWVIAAPAALRILAAAWATTAVVFFVIAAIVWHRPAAARRPLAAVVAVSLALSVATLWAAVAGVVIDAALLVLVVAAPRAILTDEPAWSAIAHGGRR
jgi:hypothetical protein